MLFNCTPPPRNKLLASCLFAPPEPACHESCYCCNRPPVNRTSTIHIVYTEYRVCVQWYVLNRLFSYLDPLFNGTSIHIAEQTCLQLNVLTFPPYAIFSCLPLRQYLVHAERKHTAIETVYTSLSVCVASDGCQLFLGTLDWLIEDAEYLWENNPRDTDRLFWTRFIN